MPQVRPRVPLQADDATTWAVEVHVGSGGTRGQWRYTWAVEVHMGAKKHTTLDAGTFT